ncbi:endolytic transglycosylase MltG [Streptomyces sp. BI20]|uniref:endolytic transglycosylase MltG n=1 Tax=Streptomyces sp. BI20 TaxID=3403460 RepID=UPI003C741150
MRPAYRHPPHPPSRRGRARLTRRGRLTLFLTALTAVGALILLLPDSGDPPSAPPEARRLVVPEGRRATEVYAAVDRALRLPAGSAAAEAARLRPALPAEAKGNPEGFLFPATYPLTDGTTAGGLLAHMVRTATERIAAPTVAGPGKAHGMTPYQIATMASIVQAEADNKADMGKVARVIHNRLARSMPLQMDSTVNYALRRSTLDTSLRDTRVDHPFNTYRRQGLPPTPIDNPGAEALAAAVAPTPGNWLYFVTVAPGDTRFAADYAAHQRNVELFNKNRAAAKAGPPRP